MRQSMNRVAVVLMVCMFANVARLQAQPCVPGWQPTAGILGPSENVFAMTLWDKDGPGGPAPELLVLGGSFSAVRNVRAKCIATWNPATGEWAALGTPGGSGLSSWVSSLTTLPNTEGGHDLIIGGAFDSVDGMSAEKIVRWDGQSWHQMGSPNFTWSVDCFAKVANPASVGGVDLYVGGGFREAFGAVANFVARWDGSQWHPLGVGTVGDVGALVVLPKPGGVGNYLIAGGSMIEAGGAPASAIAMWDIELETWQILGELETDIPLVRDLEIIPNPASPAGYDVYAAGNFHSIGGVAAERIARWDGAAWHTVGAGYTGDPSYTIVTDLARIPDGQGGFDLVAVGATGDLNSGAFGPIAGGVARWDGANWSALGNGLPSGLEGVIVLNSGSGTTIIATGLFDIAGYDGEHRIARWDSGNWAPLDSGPVSGTDNPVSTTLVMEEGGIPVLYIGGTFSTVNGVDATAIARWDGISWSALGSGLAGGGFWGTSVGSLEKFPRPGGGYDLIVSGEFTEAGGQPAHYIARWDGTNWHPIGTGLENGMIYDIAVRPNGIGGHELIALGEFPGGLARWNGTAWESLPGTGSGPGPVGASISVLGILPTAGGGADLIAGGVFFDINGVPMFHIGRWDGAQWHAMGENVPGGGTSGNPGDPPYYGRVSALEALPNGVGGYDLYAGGDFTYVDGQLAPHVARWDGTAWHPLGSGISEGQILDMHPFPRMDGGYDLLVGGNFDDASSIPDTKDIARWNPQFGWESVGSVTDAFGSAVISISALPNQYGRHDIVAGGNFITIGNTVSPRIAFWRECATQCTELAIGDVNGDLLADGADIQWWVGMIGETDPFMSGFCQADMDYNGIINAHDVPLFVASLLVQN